jgi:LmbE family N-acetylglucosaminyl deacetylase
VRQVEMLSYSDCQLHEKGHELIREIEQRLGGSNAGSNYDLVLSHAQGDSHADHRTAHESTLSAVRDFQGTVLLYQSPSVKPNGFHPTFFPRLEEVDMDRKDLSIQAHTSQRHRIYTRVSRTRGLADNWSIYL